MTKRLRADKLNELEDGDRVIDTRNGPVFVCDGRYFSVNRIVPFGAGVTKYELRYELLSDDEFAYFGLEKPG